MSRHRFTTSVRRHRRGFTLLEVLLGLALTALVLVAIAMAVDIHLRLIGSNRTGVEEAQLARALLDRISADLRSAILYAPLDVDKLIGDVASQAGAAGGGSTGGASAGGTAGLEDFLGEEGGAEDSGTDGIGDLSESSEPQSEPGLFGNANQLQVDTGRLPRVDELMGMVTAGAATTGNVVSDVKTVAYYVIDDQLGGTGYGPGTSQSGSGLVRLEYARATAVWAAEQGLMADLEQDVVPIAPEVAVIEFRYYDGTEWVEEWDSTERGGLPVAVEIAIGIIPARLRNDTEFTSLLTSTQPSLTDVEDLLIFRRLVHLPVAQPTTEEGASTMSESSDESSEGTGGSAMQGGSP